MEREDGEREERGWARGHRRIPARMTPGPVAVAHLTRMHRAYLPRVSVEASIIIRIYADLCVDHPSPSFLRLLAQRVASNLDTPIPLDSSIDSESSVFSLKLWDTFFFLPERFFDLSRSSDRCWRRDYSLTVASKKSGLIECIDVGSRGLTDLDNSLGGDKLSGTSIFHLYELQSSRV